MQLTLLTKKTAMTRQEALEVYKTQHERFRQTKELQWKINLASWALIALAINSASNIKGNISELQVILIAIAFFIAQMIFSWRTQRALEADKIISREILRQLNEEKSKATDIQFDIKKLTKKIYPGTTGIWWLIFQALTTSVLLIMFGYMAT